MLFALVVMAGVLLLTMVVNNRRRPSSWDRDDQPLGMGRRQRRRWLSVGIQRRRRRRLGL